MERIRLVDISPRAWEHPADRAALAALRKVPGFDEVLRFFVGMTREKRQRLLFLASAVRVNEKQFPRLNEMLDEARHVLDVADRPDLYVTQDATLNAYAIGVDKPFIALNSSMLDTLGDDELLAVIAHELGHIVSGHALYITLLLELLKYLRFGIRFLPVPVALAVAIGVFVALMEWFRKAELSCDRAGLLVVQNIDVSNTVLMKLAGGKHFEEMDLEEFIRQADDYEAGGDLLDGFYKAFNLIFETHPYAALRVSGLRQWVASGAYETIVGGEYEKRSTEEDDVFKDFKEANKTYQEELKSSKDPFAKAMSNIGEGLESVRQEAERFFGSLFGGGPKDE